MQLDIFNIVTKNYDYKRNTHIKLNFSKNFKKKMYPTLIKLILNTNMIIKKYKYKN